MILFRLLFVHCRTSRIRLRLLRKRLGIARERLFTDLPDAPKYRIIILLCPF